MPVVRVSAASLLATSAVATSTRFTEAQADEFAVAAYKMRYASPENFLDNSVTVSQLQKIRVFVAYAPLASFAASSSGSVDYTSWAVTHVEGEYASVYTGPIPAAPFPAKDFLLTIEVHDAAEPDRLTLPGFDGPVQMLYGYEPPSPPMTTMPGSMYASASSLARLCAVLPRDTLGLTTASRPPAPAAMPHYQPAFPNAQDRHRWTRLPLELLLLPMALLQGVQERTAQPRSAAALLQIHETVPWLVVEDRLSRGQQTKERQDFAIGEK